MNLNKIMKSIVILFSIGLAGAHAQTDSDTRFKILNIKQVGHSDGYITKVVQGVEKNIFVGTNHYKAQLEVNNQNKKVLIDIAYSITDPKVTGSTESPEQPSNIRIGEEILTGKIDIEDRYVKNTSQKELEQVRSIGLDKEVFDKMLKKQFIQVYYM